MHSIKLSATHKRKDRPVAFTGKFELCMNISMVGGWHRTFAVGIVPQGIDQLQLLTKSISHQACNDLWPFLNVPHMTLWFTNATFSHLALHIHITRFASKVNNIQMDRTYTSIIKYSYIIYSDSTHLMIGWSIFIAMLSIDSIDSLQCSSVAL